MSVKLSPEALEAKKAYNRNWRKAHPDKVIEYQNRYWSKVMQKAKQSEKEGEAVTAET